MKKLLTIIIALLFYCSVAAQNYISEDGTAADSFRVGGNRYFTFKLDADSNFVEVNVNGYLKRFITRDMLLGLTTYVKWYGEATSDPLTPGSGSIYYHSVNDLFKIYTEGEGSWLTFLFAERSYSNPSWLTTLAWSKINARPTTLVGYGITDAAAWMGELSSDPLEPANGSIYYNYSSDLFKIYTVGESMWLTFLFADRTYSNPAWLSSLAWSKISSKPTTLSGYGITDGVSISGSYSDPSWLTSLAWSKISSKPTTLSGYGITDGVSTSGSYSDPSWITSLAWSKISSKPTTLSGYGITNGMIWGGESTSDPLTPGSGTVYYNSVNDLFKIYTEGEGVWLTFLFADRSYSNPSWLTSLAWSKISSKPTTLSGYGITDGVSTSGSYSDPSWLTSFAWSKISSKPTTLSGYGITNGMIWGGESTSDPISPGSGTVYYNSVNDLFKIYTEGEGVWLTFLFADRSYSNPSWLTSLAWSKISSKPTTLSGYGITDGASTTADNSYSGKNTYNNLVVYDNEILLSAMGDANQSVSGKNTLIITTDMNYTITLTNATEGQWLFVSNHKDSADSITLTPVRGGTSSTITLARGKSVMMRFLSSEGYWYSTTP